MFSQSPAGHDRSCRGLGASFGFVRDHADGPRRYGSAALHQRHDLHADDIFWCTADPGWVTGTSYGIISPLTNGVTMVIDQAEFDAERWYRILQDLSLIHISEPTRP